MKKRIFSLFLTIVLLISMAPTNAFAAQEDYYAEGATIELPEGVTPTSEDYPIDTARGNEWVQTGQTRAGTALTCGQEAHHTFNCAVPCEKLHSHTDDCYAKVYQCGQAEHTHDASCNSLVYTCGQEESTGHQHGEACYTAELICGKETGQDAHTHDETCHDAEGSLICTGDTDGHQHSEACYSSTLTCGKEVGEGAHSHAESGCASEEKQTCGQAEHTHTAECGYVLGELTCALDDTHVCVTNGCSADCTETHHTEDCYSEVTYVTWGVANYGLVTADETYEVKFVVSDDSGTYNTTVTITDEDGATYSVTTDNSNNSFGNGQNRSYYGTTSLPAGNYTATVSQTSGSKVYSGQQTFTVAEDGTVTAGGSEVTQVTITVDGIYSREHAVNKYNTTTSFNHVDIRVNGTYILTDGSELPLTVSNVYLTVMTNGSYATYTESGRPGQSDTTVTIKDLPLTGTTSFEWRTTGLNLSKTTTVVTVKCDVTIGSGSSAVVYEDVEIVYDSYEDIIKAIQICNNGEGLDFEVTLEDIQEAIDYYNVTYQWRVYDVSNTEVTTLPASFPNPPTDNKEYVAEETHTIDTGYTSSSTFIDYVNKKVYSFSGWIEWWDEDTNKTAIGDATELTMTSDTVIYGIWTVADLPDATGYLYVDKEFLDEPTEENPDIIAHPEAAENLWFQITAPYNFDSTNTEDISYSMIAERKAAGETGRYVPVYGEGQHTIVEYAADIDGYTRTTTITINSESHASTEQGNFDYITGTQSGDTLTYTINLPAVDVSADGTAVAASDPVYLGEIQYTNSYVKNVGADKVDFPALRLVKIDSASASTFLGGAVFTLYSDADCTTALTYADGTAVTITTDSTGLAALDLDNVPGIQAGSTYYLKETTVPDGYQLSDAVHSFTVVEDTVGTESLVEKADQTGYEFVTTYTHTLSYSAGSGATAGSNGLTVTNDKILGKFSIRKSFTDTSKTADTSDDKAIALTTGYIALDVHGPVTFKEDGTTIDSLGSTRDIRVSYNEETESWQADITGLELGTYFLHETFASVHGYTWLGVEYGAGTVTTVTDSGAEVEGVLLEVTADNAEEGISLSIVNSYQEWDAVDFYIYKTDNYTDLASRKALAGAEFTLYTDAVCTKVLTLNGAAATVTTDDTGNAHFENLSLPTGPNGDKLTEVTYYLKETKAPAGYYLSDTVYRVHIFTNNNAIDIEILASDGSALSSSVWNSEVDALYVKDNAITGSLTISKDIAGDLTEDTFKDGTGTIEIHIADAAGNVLHTATLSAGNNWTTTISGLALGTYTVYELEAFADQTGYTRTTTANVDNDTSDNTPAAAVESNKVTVTISEAATVGLHTSGYQPNASVSFTNTYEKNVAELDVEPASFLVYKHSADDHIPLQGAAFTLFTHAGCEPGTEVNAKDVPEGFTTTASTNANGIAYFDGLKLSDLNDYTGKTERSVTFYLKETAAPDGYIADGTIYQVVLTEDFIKVDELNQTSGFFETVIDWIVGVFNPSSTDSNEACKDLLEGDDILIIHNTKKQTKLNVTKEVKYYNDGALVTDVNTINSLKNLTDENGNLLVNENYGFTVTIDGVENNITLTEGGKETYDISYLDAYSVVETATGSFNLSEITDSNLASNHKVELSKATTSGTIGLDRLSDPDGNGPLTTAEVNVKFTNTYKFSKYDEHDPEDPDSDNMRACLEFQKVDSTAPTKVLSGVQFELLNADKTEVVDSGTTGTDGKLHLHVTEAGTYYLHEVETIDGYKLRTEDIEIVVEQVYEPRTLNGEVLISKKLVAKIGGELMAEPYQVTNVPTPGKVTIKKAFKYGNGYADDMPAEDSDVASIIVHLHGPVTRNDSNTIISGMDNYVRVVMDSTNNWEETVENLEIGEYLVHEAFASVHGYTWKEVAYGAGTKTETYEDNEYVVLNITADAATHNLELNIENRYTVWEAADFYIRKIDSKTDNVITDVTVDNFTLYAKDTAGAFTVDVTDDFYVEQLADGRIHFDGFAADEGCYDEKETVDDVTTYTKYYQLKETTAPDNYKALNTVWLITVTHAADKYDLSITVASGANNMSSVDEHSDTLTIKNEPYLGSLEITKEFAGDLLAQSETNPDGIAAAYFQIKDSSGTVVDTAVLTSDNSWTDVIENLRMGTYTITEVSGDRIGHTLVVDYEGTGITETDDGAVFTLTAPETGSENPAQIEVKATNTYTRNRAGEVVNPASFEVYKIDNYSNPLSGAAFTLYSDENCFTEVKTVTTGADGIAVFTELYGNRVESDVPAEKRPVETVYYLKETAAPAGYELDSDITWKVTLNADTNTLKLDVLNEQTGLFETIIDWIANLMNEKVETEKATWSYDNGKLIVKNVPKTTTLTVKKVVKFLQNGEIVTDSDTIQTLKEVKDTDGNALISDSYTFDVNLDGTQQDSFTLGDGDNKEFTVGYNSTYAVDETVAEGALYTKTLPENYAGTIQLKSGTTDPAPVTVTVTNTYSFWSFDGHDDEVDGDLSLCLVFKKIDSVTAEALKNATFTLYESDKTTAVQTIITGEDGILHFDVSKEGTYYLYENTAPDKYDRLTDYIEINVSKQYTTAQKDDQTVIIDKLVAKIGDTVLDKDTPYEIGNKLSNISISVQKVWDDGDYYKRPRSVTVDLLKDGVVQTGKTVTLNARNNWTATWEDLDAYATWTVQETPIHDGYETTYSEMDENGMITITNTRIPQKIQINVKKVWNVSGVSIPSSITVELYRNGKLYLTEQITASDNWTKSWTVTDNYEWTVKEVKMSGFYTKYSQKGNNWTITNTASVIPQTGDSFHMLWFGVLGASGTALMLLLLLTGKRKYKGKYGTR